MGARMHTRITADPLGIDEAHVFASDPRSGAVVVFTGTVRNHAEGRGVARLTYEAFEGQAEARLAALAREITDKWPTVRALWMEHRTGVLAIGEPAVVVAVSADHRAEAFEAASYGIDTLKATVPIWKKEHWTDGTAHWPGTD